MVVGLALLAGCATTPSQPGTTKSAPTVNLEVFRDGTIPTKPCKVIAVLKDDGPEEEQEQIEAKMIRKARRMGGQAIVFDAAKENGFKSEFLGSFKVTYLYEAKVVVYP